jgi:hypothetical protein
MLKIGRKKMKTKKEENRMENITISYNEYLKLLIAEAKLSTLESAGVDNWINYGCNCNITGADECIFCTEDAEKFLGLK